MCDRPLASGCVTLSGVGLHTGAPSSVILSLQHGPTSLSQAGASSRLDELRVLRTDHGVQVSGAQGRLSIDLVEHLFAALAAYHALWGVSVEVAGPEVPLLDGGARRFALALDALGLVPRAPTLRIAREAEYAFGSTRYQLTPASEVRVDVEVEFDPPLGKQQATFNGELPQFLDNVASARTFGFVRDADALIASGRAGSVNAGGLLVFNDDGTLAIPARAPTQNELAAHKLLDLIGDSLLYGALPHGSIAAFRPGHTSNHAMFQRALAEGVLAPVQSTTSHTAH